MSRVRKNVRLNVEELESRVAPARVIVTETPPEDPLPGQGGAGGGNDDPPVGDPKHPFKPYHSGRKFRKDWGLM